MNRDILKLGFLLSILFVVPDASFAERLGVCGPNGGNGVCETKSMQAFRVAARIVDDALMGCSASFSPCFAGGVDPDERWDKNVAVEVAYNFITKTERVNLEFKSERDNPGFFFLDGQVRIAKTGSNLGDVIYINTDMAEANNVDISEAIAVLAHELAHHIGIEDHQRLDRFGAKLVAYLNKFKNSALEIIPGAAGGDQAVELFVFNLGNAESGDLVGLLSDGNTTIILWDGFDYIDLTKDLQPKLCDDGFRLKSFNIRSFELVPAENNALLAKLPMAYQCVPTNGFYRNHFDLNAYASLPTKKIGDRTIIDADHIKWEIRKCSEDHDLGCVP
jgi:hypothetical protein